MKTTLDSLLEEIRILRAQEGDQASFERLIGQYHSKLAYYVRRLTGDDEAVKDILQDVWLDVYRQIRRLRSPQAFSVWLYRIARNKAVEFIRARQHYILDFKEMENVPADCELPNFESNDAAKIHAALQTLKPEHRDALVLYFLENMTYEQIANVIECPVGTVRSRIHYAKRALRQAMEENHDK